MSILGGGPSLLSARGRGRTRGRRPGSEGPRGRRGRRRAQKGSLREETLFSYRSLVGGASLSGLEEVGVGPVGAGASGASSGQQGAAGKTRGPRGRRGEDPARRRAQTGSLRQRRFVGHFTKFDPLVVPVRVNPAGVWAPGWFLRVSGSGLNPWASEIFFNLRRNFYNWAPY